MFMTRYGSVASQIVGGGGGYDEYTKSLLHFNGTDGSTTFTDEIGRLWTANGGAQLDTAQKKFGTAAGHFNGLSWIDTPDSEDFNVGSGDFTVDFWVRRNSTGGNHYICGQIDAAGDGRNTSIIVSFNNSNYPRIAVRSGAVQYSTSYGTTAVTADGAWHHIAAVRNGNTLTLYLDGVAQGTSNITGVTINNSAYKFAVGRAGEFNASHFNGWIDEFRFSKGIARWTSNFTPPTGEYTA